MPGTIDIHGLSQEEIETVRRFADFLREKARGARPKPDNAEEDVEFSTWNSTVKGKITRKEIYDFL